MKDTLNCPICGDKMRTNKGKMHVHFIDKTADYVSRICNGIGHSLQIVVDKKTKEVDLLKVSLLPNYSRFIIIDFYNQKCRILLIKDGKEKYLEIPKMIFPDFPHLTKLKEKVSIYIIMS